MWAGIVTASVGIEFAILATPEPALSLGSRVAVCGGIALYLLAVSAVQLATPRSLRRSVLVWRLVVVALALVRTGSGPLALVGILALALIGPGESIVVLTSAVIDTDWQPASALAAVFGFAIAACLWWLYFDRVDEGAIAQSFTGGVAGVVRSHV